MHADVEAALKSRLDRSNNMLQSLAPINSGGDSVKQHPSAKPFVIGGALVGAAAMTAGLIIYFKHHSGDSLTPPLALVPAVLGSAAIGALGGWIVHRLAYQD